MCIIRRVAFPNTKPNNKLPSKTKTKANEHRNNKKTTHTVGKVRSCGKMLLEYNNFELRMPFAFYVGGEKRGGRAMRGGC